MSYQTTKYSQNYVKWHNVEIFSAHERDGKVVDYKTLQSMADRANRQLLVGHKYYITRTHQGEDTVGWMQNYRVGKSDVVIGDNLVADCPTLYADLVVRKDISKGMAGGKWPRRSCTAEISQGHMISCSLLGPHEDSWFGYQDLNGQQYKAVVASVGGAKIAMYSKSYQKEGLQMDPTKDENGAAKMEVKPEEPVEPPAEEPIKEEVPEEIPEEVVDDKPQMSDMLEFFKEMFAIYKEFKGIEKGVPAEPPAADYQDPAMTPDPMPGGADMAIEGEVDKHLARGYTLEYGQSIEQRVKDSGKNLVPKEVRESAKIIYAKFGKEDADRFVDTLLKAVTSAPGTDPGEEVTATADAALASKYNAEQKKVIAYSVSKFGHPETAKRLREYDEYCARLGTELDITIEEWMQHQYKSNSMAEPVKG